MAWEEHPSVGDQTMSSATINIDLAAGRAALADDDRATAGIVYAYTASAVFWLLVGSAYGTLAACKLVWPDLLPYEWLSFGRIRPIHTASVLLGWLSVGLTGIAYLVVYRTARRALFSNALAHAGLWLLNLALFAGLVTLSLGITRGPVEYREWLTPIAAVFAAGSLLNGGNIFVTLVRRLPPMASCRSCCSARSTASCPTSPARKTLRCASGFISGSRSPGWRSTSSPWSSPA